MPKMAVYKVAFWTDIFERQNREITVVKQIDRLNRWKDMRDGDILYLLIGGRPVYLERVTNWRDK